jgi:hypothetical protein
MKSIEEIHKAAATICPSVNSYESVVLTDAIGELATLRARVEEMESETRVAECKHDRLANALQQIESYCMDGDMDFEETCEKVLEIARGAPTSEYARWPELQVKVDELTAALKAKDDALETCMSALLTISEADYRGNRSNASQIARAALLRARGGQ